MKLATFFISGTRRILRKPLDVFKSSIKMKVKSHWTLFVILFASAVIFNKTFTWKRDSAISSG